MDQVARLPLGGRRWQPYVKTLRFSGVDLTGADLRLQVRLYRNAPGQPVIDLVTVTNGNAEGLRLVSVEMVDDRPVSTVAIKINETTIEGLVFLGEAGDDTVLAYDLQITPVGGYKQVWVEGEFWVLAAVTGADAAELGEIGGGARPGRTRPSFAAGSSTFQVGDSVVVLNLGPAPAPPGPKGDKGDPGGGGGESEGVYLDEYPGTTTDDDPFRLDNDNAKLAAARADTRDPDSPNFGKIIFIRPGGGSAERSHMWTGVNDPFTGVPVPAKYLPRPGFAMIDSFTQNGRVLQETPTVIIVDKGNVPGNIGTGDRIHILPGAGVMRPPRPDHGQALRPLIFGCDPNATPATTNGAGIDTQSDVYLNQEIVCHGDAAFYGENYRWAYREHHNDLSFNGASDFLVRSNHYATMSDPLYIGAGNIGGGMYNRHNKRGEIHVTADGRNQNNRNVVSIIDCVGLRGTVRGYNYSRSGGPGNDPFNPNSGNLAPGIVDVEPNAFTDDPHIDDIELDVYAEDSGSSAVSTLLIDNNNIPTPLGSMRFTGRAVRCKHGKHTLIGAVNMKTPYQIHVRMDAIDCDSPFELLTGQGCTHEGGRNLRSKKAGLIGFTAFAAPQDFWRRNEIDQELGSTDTAAIQVRGWNGGGIDGGQMINAQNKGYHLLSNTGTSPIRDLIVGPYTFVNRANITSQTMVFPFYVDPSNGGPQLFSSSITERNINYNGLQSYMWAVSGSYVKSIPGSGLWTIGQEVLGDPSLEPGSPRIMRTRATNASGPPSFFVQQQIGGFVPDGSGGMGIGANWTFVNMDGVTNGRFTARAPLARAYGPSSGQPQIAQISGKTPFSGSATVYVGVTQSANPTTVADLLFGIWFGDTTGGATGVGRAILTGGAAGSPFTFKYGDSFRVAATGGQTGGIYFTPAGGSEQTIATSGAPGGTFRYVILINVAGETVQIVSVAT